MKEIFGQRLLNARKQAGFSQDELVDKIEGLVKKTAIAKYERGEMMPKPKVIEMLAKVLKQPMDYFFKPISLSITKVEFRAKSSMGARLEEQLRQTIANGTERYLELEELLGLNSVFVNPFEGVVISSSEQIEHYAAELHNIWHLGKNPLGSIMGILEDQGIKVIEIESTNHFEGFSALANNKYPVIVVRKNATTERRRFTALHELAHTLFLFDEGLPASKVEKLCHQFAGAVLIPREVFFREFGSYRTDFSRRELGIIKDKYGISAIAFVKRASDLGVISQPRLIPLYSMLRKDPLEKHIGSNNSTDNATRFDQLLVRALTEGYISLAKAAELAQLELDTFIQNYTDND